MARCSCKRRRRPVFVLEPDAAVGVDVDDGRVHRLDVQFHREISTLIAASLTTKITKINEDAKSILGTRKSFVCFVSSW